MHSEGSFSQTKEDINEKQTHINPVVKLRSKKKTLEKKTSFVQQRPALSYLQYSFAYSTDTIGWEAAFEEDVTDLNTDWA